MFVLIENNKNLAKHIHFQRLNPYQNKTAVCRQQFLHKSAVYFQQLSNVTTPGYMVILCYNPKILSTSAFV
jgi:hypothetical protein